MTNHYDLTGAWAPVIAASRERAATMAVLYAEGYTLAEIGEQFHLTRERVRQLIKKHFKMVGENGGQHVRAERSRAKRAATKDRRYLVKYGCTVEQWQALREIGRNMRAEGKGLYQTPLRAFCNQRNNAHNRGIGWELNLWQWWTIWQTSGHWFQRGLLHGCYVMCREGDEGPYAVGNVFIALSSENVSQGTRKSDLPIGVGRTKSGKFTANRVVGGKRCYLGSFETPELAHAAYLKGVPASRQKKSSGLPPGVCRSQRCTTNPFKAYIYVSSKYRHLGCFANPEAAHAAHLAAKASLLSIAA